MAVNTHIYEEAHNKSGIQHIFERIRADVEQAYSREALTNLYSRAGYMITLTHASLWERECGNDCEELRELAEAEFSETVRKINNQAKQIGAGDNYDETWGD